MSETPTYSYDFVVGFPIWLHDEGYLFNSFTNLWETTCFHIPCAFSTEEVFNMYLESRVKEICT